MARYYDSRTGTFYSAHENSTDHTLFRQYSFVQGRWISPDPSNGSYVLTDPQSLNRYAYLTNRPMNAVDRLGLDCGDGGQGDASSCGDDDDGGQDWVFTGICGSCGDGIDVTDTSVDLSIPYVPIELMDLGTDSTVATADSSQDAAPDGGGATDAAAGNGGSTTAGDVFVDTLMVAGNIPEIGTIANAAVAAVDVARGQYGQAFLFSGLAVLSAVGVPGGDAIADGVATLRAASEVSETALEAGEESAGANIALGSRYAGLRTFANDIGADHLLDVPESQWQDVFMSHVQDPTTTFHVNMGGFFGSTPEEMIVNEMNSGSNTGWELQQLNQAGRLGQVNFYQNGAGTLIRNPF